MSKEAASYCAEQIRRLDRDRYLTALFAPKDRRGAIFALYAFNLEIAKTRETVSQPMLGQIRLQWWREAVDECFAGRVREHLVLRALAAAIGSHGLPRAAFDRLIDAREFDLEDRPPADFPQLESYADETATPLILLALKVLDAETAETVLAARHVGIAQAIVGLLRAVPAHARAKRLYLPTRLMDAAELRSNDLFELRSTPALGTVVGVLAQAAYSHLEAARALSPKLPAAALPALLPAVLARSQLRRIERLGGDVLRPALARPQILAPLLLAWRAFRGGI